MQKFRFEERKQRNRRERPQNVKEMRFFFFVKIQFVTVCRVPA